jgi:phosphoglucosamine mutase
VKRLFGTDGIRAVAGDYPLDPPTVRRFGLALAAEIASDPGARVALGRDTRESGEWLRDAVADGLASGGVNAVDAGVITTPGLAHAVRHGPFAAGVMISASHNPFRDNGLKAFGPDGIKLADDAERRIEGRVLDDGLDDPGGSGRSPAVDPDLVAAYVGHLERLIPDGRFRGLKLTLDCSNGSAHHIAPEVFRHFGAEVVTIGDRPDGRNINLDCGSLHLDALARHVVADDSDAGLAFDGDADRCLAVDARGRVVDGDAILFICGRGLQQSGRLRGRGVVATIMSNFWLQDRLDREGIRLERTQVGDKYVLEKMIGDDLVLGGEQSGHVIFREHATTGDGILTGLLLLDTLMSGGEKLAEIMDGIAPYPQILINVPVREKPDLREHPAVGPEVSRTESELDGQGRVVLRYSGTESLARVMIEGKDESTVKRLAESLAAVIRRELGSEVA